MESLWLVIVSLVLVSTSAAQAADEAASVDVFTPFLFYDIDETDLIEVAVGKNDTDGVLAGLDVSPTCLSEMSSFFEDLRLKKAYALQMKYSFPIPPNPESFLFTYRWRYLGDFEVCDSVKADRYPEAPFDAIPCMMRYHLYPEVRMELGACYPQSCSEDDLEVVIMSVIQEFGRNDTLQFVCSRPVPISWDILFSWFLILLFVGLMIFGTAYDYLSHPSRRGREKPVPQSDVAPEENPATGGAAVRENDAPVDSKVGVAAIEMASLPQGESQPDQPNPGNVEQVDVAADGRKSKILLAFSVSANWAQVLSLKRPKGNLAPLDGIRVLSMFWIMYLHNWFFLQHSVDNFKYLNEAIRKRILFEITENGDLGVDSFFVLSGLLVTYLYLTKGPRVQGCLGWVKFFFYRYVRLTPVYVFAMFMFVSFARWLGRGYQKTEYFSEQLRKCEAYWWTNLLYINNLIPHPFVLSECFGWSWYLANDMQMFFFTPIYLYLLSSSGRKERIGVIVVFAVAASSVLFTMFVTAVFGIPVGNVNQGHNNIYFEGAYNFVYSNVLCRVHAYMVGVFCGYILYKYKDRGLEISKWVNLSSWFGAICTVLAVVFAMGFSSYSDPLPYWFSILWIGTSRFLFAAAVGWIIMACVTGHGGIVSRFLSWDIWAPLSRLTYCAYLFHPIVMLHYATTFKDQLHWNPYTSTYMFLGFLVATYSVSLVASLLVEIPLLRVAKLFFGRLANRR